MSKLSNYESDLLRDWLLEMKNNEKDFQKAMLPKEMIHLTNYCCQILLQDVHVFLTALEILREYVIETTKKNIIINDPALTTVTAVFISNKFTGNRDLKIKSLEELLFGFTGDNYDVNVIQLQEREMLKTLNNNIPLRTIADDLCILLVKFERHYQLTVSIIPACLEVLELLYLTRDAWFVDIKEQYSVGTNAQTVFNNLMKSRFYIPICILGYVLKFSAYKNKMDVNKLLKHLASKVEINSDHIFLLINKLREVFLQHSE